GLAAQREPDLLRRLAQRRLLRRLAGVAAPARHRPLPRVCPQSPCAPDQQQAGLPRVHGDAHRDRRLLQLRPLRRHPRKARQPPRPRAGNPPPPPRVPPPPASAPLLPNNPKIPPPAPPPPPPPRPRHSRRPAPRAGPRSRRLGAAQDPAPASA